MANVNWRQSRRDEELASARGGIGDLVGELEQGVEGSEGDDELLRVPSHSRI